MCYQEWKETPDLRHPPFQTSFIATDKLGWWRTGIPSIVAQWNVWTINKFFVWNDGILSLIIWSYVQITNTVYSKSDATCFVLYFLMIALHHFLNILYDCACIWSRGDSVRFKYRARISVMCLCSNRFRYLISKIPGL